MVSFQLPIPVERRAAAIQAVAHEIVEKFHPQKIILFGSYAYGIPTEDSDVDLLVLIEPPDSTLRTAARISAAIEHPFPLDILVWAPRQFEESVQRKGSFATEVASKGVVLYEARD